MALRLGTGRPLNGPPLPARRPPRWPVVAFGLLFAGALAAAAVVGWNRGGAPDLSAYDEHVEAAAREFRLDPHLVRGMIAAESGGRADVVSRAGARGLMQLVPSTAREQAALLGLPEPSEDDLFRPGLNVRLGAAYLARMLRRFDGEEAFAVAAYNAGPSRVERWRRAAPDADAMTAVMREGFEETRAYVARVFGYRKAYRERY